MLVLYNTKTKHDCEMKSAIKNLKPYIQGLNSNPNAYALTPTFALSPSF